MHMHAVVRLWVCTITPTVPYSNRPSCSGRVTTAASLLAPRPRLAMGDEQAHVEFTLGTARLREGSTFRLWTNIVSLRDNLDGRIVLKSIPGGPGRPRGDGCPREWHHVGPWYVPVRVRLCIL